MGTRRMFPRRYATLAVIGLVAVCSIGAVVWLTRRHPLPASPQATRVPERNARPSVPPTPRPAPTVRETRPPREGGRRSVRSNASPAERHREIGRAPSPRAEPAPIPYTAPDVAAGGGAAPAPPTVVPAPVVPGVIEPVAPLPTTGTMRPPADAVGSAALAPESAALARVLVRYQNAYSTRDASAAAAIWPTVDRRALSRAFERLQNQELGLSGCTYAVASTSATARCDGVLRYARRIGDTSPKVEQHTWTIEFVKKGAAWHIVRVSAE
jgi:hypothetical protein